MVIDAPALEEILEQLPEAKRHRLREHYGIPHGLTKRDVARRIVRAIEDRRIFEELDYDARYMLRRIGAYGGRLGPGAGAYFFTWRGEEILERLEELGLITITEEQAVIMPYEFLFAPELDINPEDSIVRFLQLIGPEGVDYLQRRFGLEPTGSNLWDAAEVGRHVSRTRQESLSGLDFEELELLGAVADVGYTAAADRIEHGPFHDVRTYNDPCEWLLDEAVAGNTLHRLACKGLLFPRPDEEHRGGWELVIPTEGWREMHAWYRERLRTRREPIAEGEKAAHKALPGVTQPLETAKRLLVEFLANDIRVTKQHTVHSREWKTLIRRLSDITEPQASSAFRMLIGLRLVCTRLFEDTDCYYVRPSARAEEFLRCLGRDRDRFAWHILSDAGGTPRRRSEEVEPEFEPPFIGVDVLRFLDADRRTRVSDVSQAFCFVPYHQVECRDILNDVVSLLRDLGWIELGTSGGELWARQTPAGQAIALEEPAPVAEPAPCDRPLLVQPNGRVIAEPVCSMEILSTVARLGDVVSVDPVFCFQLAPKKVKRCVVEGTPPVGPREFLAAHSRLRIPATVNRLLADIEGSVVSGDMTVAGGIVALASPEAASALARAPGAERAVTGVIGSFVLLEPGVSPPEFARRMRREGFSLRLLPSDDFCRRTWEPPASPEPEPPETPGELSLEERLARAASSGAAVSLLYQPRGGQAQRLRVVVKRITRRSIFARDAAGVSRRLDRDRIVSVGGNGEDA